MTTSMSTLNERVGWAWNTASSLSWFRDNAKPSWRAYNLENFNGLYWYQSNKTGWTWGTVNCNGSIQVSNDYSEACGAYTANWAYRLVAQLNCCQDYEGQAGEACNCTNACGNCYDNCSYNPSYGWYYNYMGAGTPFPLAFDCGNTYQCAQCDIGGNCDSRAWMQPNCNCAQCNCACNCMNAGQCTQLPNCNCNCDCITCFLQGTPVLMADLTWKAVETIEPGELVWTVEGPYPVDHIEKPKLGPRRMFRFTDKSLIWSEEHPFWARRADGKEWLWTAGPEVWRNEVRSGGMGGLKDNFSIWSGEGYEFAHISGFVKREVEEVTGYSPETQLYAAITNGPMVIAAGYLAAAGTNEFVSDYTKTKWEEMRPQLPKEQKNGY